MVGRAGGGGGDLVDDLKEGRVKLASLKKEELPAEMQKMTLEEQEEFIKGKSEKRQQFQTKVNALVKQRQTFIDAELQKLIQAGKGNAFDTQVAQIIHEQARRKGIDYGKAPATQPAQEQLPHETKP